MEENLFQSAHLAADERLIGARIGVAADQIIEDRVVAVRIDVLLRRQIQWPDETQIRLRMCS